MNKLLYVTAAIALGGLKAERPVYLKLMEKNQNTDPFKFILYAAKIGEQVPQIGDHAEEPRGRSAARP